jgi:hypothetical protein
MRRVEARCIIHYTKAGMVERRNSNKKYLVPGAGLEPACFLKRKILNLLCIPFHHPGN